MGFSVWENFCRCWCPFLQETCKSEMLLLYLKKTIFVFALIDFASATTRNNPLFHQLCVNSFSPVWVFIEHVGSISCHASIISWLPLNYIGSILSSGRWETEGQGLGQLNQAASPESRGKIQESLSLFFHLIGVMVFGWEQPPVRLIGWISCDGCLNGGLCLTPNSVI